MTHVTQNGLGDILSNYADVIEGGNGYAGGDAYKGIPGVQSNDKEIRNGNDASVTASGNGTTTTAVYASGDWEESRWVKDHSPGFFLLCTGATNTQNIDASRRITGWDNVTKTFTVDAFPAATKSADTFTVLQGFKRLPNQLDIESDDQVVPGGFDRFFELSALPGTWSGWAGDGTVTYETELHLKLRIQNHGRTRDETDSAFSNLAILRSLLTLGTHRNDAVRGLVDGGLKAEVVTKDKDRIVLLDKYLLTYTVNRTFL